MTKRVLGLSATLAVLFLAAVAVLAAQVTRPGDTLQRWEYHTEVVRGPGASMDQRTESGRRAAASTDEMLNSLGREGWELAGLTRREIRVDDMMQTETIYALKRPMRSVNR